MPIHRDKLETELIFHHFQSCNFDEAGDLQEMLSFSILKMPLAQELEKLRKEMKQELTR